MALLGRAAGKPELAVAVIYPHGGKHALRKKNLLETVELMQELHLNDLLVYMGGDWNMVIDWDVDTANCSSKSKNAGFNEWEILAKECELKELLAHYRPTTVRRPESDLTWTPFAGDTAPSKTDDSRETVTKRPKTAILAVSRI